MRCETRLETSESRYASGVFRLLFLFFCIFVSATSTEAAPKRHKVTVGMYNTYSIQDGNLGRAEPDLKEVWEGIPGISEFEACNITMHYWPRPGDLPEVKAGENGYSAWWKGYMEEAYNLTNQDGEVRFRVIVGPLYSYYAAYKGDVFNGFIEDLCKWEKGSVYEGTLAGWYLTEEPMGSSHNFDHDLNSQMAEDIKAVEKSLGVPHHRMYIDVGTAGRYYSSSALAAFTRPVDVVMISAGPFLWTTSGQQPVYEPDWKRIHASTHKIREVVYSDRDRRKMPRPEIHVVLEGRDAIGHGQPTNWEMRQQIHVSLSQSSAYNDPPVDGIWFFWWSEIGINKNNDTDDWNYGRRLAEAIQTQVPRSTFEQNPWERKDYDPPETRFRFPELGSFNPTYSCIPYDLAEPGYVRIEILDENLSLVKSFDTKYQVAGELRRFGGPYWNRSGARNGSYIFRLYLNSKLMDEAKVKVQWSITVNSASHLPGVWSTDNVVEVLWEPQAEELEGLAGYSILWNTSPGSYPNTEINLPPEVTSLRSDQLPDGDSNYFHIRSVNGAGQWNAAAHLGPFYIDTTEPGNVKDLEPDSHEIGLWSRDNRVIVHWDPAEDNASGVMGYSILWDSGPGTLPDKEVDISSHTTVLASEPLSDGQYYLHVRSVDNAGNWAYTAAHTGTFLIDTEPPGGVMELVSSSHVPGQWSNSDTVSLNWKDAPDMVSGVAGYSILWDDLPDTVPDESVDIGKQTSAISPSLEPSADKAYYFHIRGVDAAGNWSAAAHLGPFYIDTTEPGNVKDLASDSHEIGLWSRDNSVIVHWDPAEDNASGVMGYSILWDSSPGTLPDKELDISSLTTVLTSEPLNVRSVSNAGAWAHTAGHTGTFLIDTSPPGGVMELVSSSHAPGQWSGSDTVSLNWKDAPDLMSGVVGYSILWDDMPDTVPDESVDIGKQTSAISPPLESSADRFHYFHIRGVDAAGNWSDDVAHAGPFMIDTEPPPKVDGLASTSHNPDEWSPFTSAYIAWNPTKDGISGITRYEWNTSQDETIPGEWKETTEAGMKLDIPEDGVWYFHVRAVDKAGNQGALESIILKVDSKPPSVPTVWSSSHPDDGAWYTDPEVAFEWQSSDEMSGIEGYNWSWDTNARTVQDEVKGMDAGSVDILVTAESPGIWYFHLRAVDKAGNWSDTARYKVQIDPSAPPAPQISSDTHIDGQWSIRNDVSLSWETPGQGPSGVTGYSFMLDHNPMSTPDEVADTGDGTYADLPDGLWYFHCRAKGGSGIWGPASHYEIRIDTTPPEISITYPQSNLWYTEPITTYSGRVEDYTSGVDWNSLQYSFGDQWVTFRSDTAQQGMIWIDQDEIPHCGETNASYLSVRVWDEAGNFRISDPVTIKVDLSISLPTISSQSHPDQDRWYNDNRPEFLWNLMDNYSGLDSYSWVLDPSESTVPPEISMTSDTYTASTKDLSDGIWYFHVRARDRAGNWSGAAHYMVKIDTVSPLATVKISGPVVTDHDPPLVRAGRVQVLLKISEPVQKASLKYQPSSRRGDLDSTADYPITIELTQAGEWEGFFDVTADTGDGEAVFSFAAYDEAGNAGNEITAGESFVIDTTPPTARLEVSGPAVVNRDPPLARSGPVEVLLQASEKIFDPSLAYKPSGAVAAVPVELTGDNRIVWSGSFNVTVHTGDGEAVFIFSARDEAGNPGSEVTEGSSFVVDTLIRAGAYETAEVLCVSEPATRISLPSGAITQDLRIEIVKDTANLSSGVLGVYEFIAYDTHMKKLEDLVFRVPVEITFSLELSPGQTGEGMLGIYYWDGVRQHKIQDTWTTLRVDYLGRFTLMRSEAMTSRIMNGWATPNPFTPNGSRDATDRTVFHVATQRGSADFTVKIYDLNGRLVKFLEDGRRVWDGTNEDGELVEGGLYIYQIKSGEQIISGTVVVLK